MLDICINNLTNEDLSEYDEIIEQILNHTLIKEQIEGNNELSIIYVDSKMIQDINRDYRNIDKVTDVISFALQDEDEDIFFEEEVDLPNLLGDIYICLERTHEQATEYGHSFKRELMFLVIHGFLHLLGYDHLTPEEEAVMFAKQEEILSGFDITR